MIVNSQEHTQIWSCGSAEGQQLFTLLWTTHIHYCAFIRSLFVPQILATSDNNSTDQICCETLLRSIDEKCFTKAKDHFYLLQFEMN